MTEPPIAIFCLDDNEGDLLLLETALVDKGITNFSMYSSVDEFYKAHRPDIAIFVLDYSLPQTNGLEVAEFIFKLNPLAKIIIHSGINDYKELKKAISMGIYEWVEKGEENHLEICATHVLNAIKWIKSLQLYVKSIKV